jgi:hypothetical protein
MKAKRLHSIRQKLLLIIMLTCGVTFFLPIVLLPTKPGGKPCGAQLGNRRQRHGGHRLADRRPP